MSVTYSHRNISLLADNNTNCGKSRWKPAVTLRKSDKKDEIDGKESQQVGVYHLIDHYDERPNDTKSSEQHSKQTVSIQGGHKNRGHYCSRLQNPKMVS